MQIYGKITQKFREELKSKIVSSEFNKYLTYKETDQYTTSCLILDCKISGRVPKTKEIEFIDLKESIFDMADNILGQDSFQSVNEIFDVTFGPCVGEKFLPIDVFDEAGSRVYISHCDQRVLLIDFWATWCKYCQEPMQENIELIREHPELAEKNVFIIGVSCDEDQQKWKDHIISKKWDILDHFNKPNILKTQNIIGIPHIIIVGKDGIINYEGHPSQINLKETLFNLAEGNKISLVKENWDDDAVKNFDWNNKYDENTKKNILYEIKKKLRDAGSSGSEIIIHTRSQMEKDGTFKKKTRFFLQGEVMNYENELIDTLIPVIENDYKFTKIIKQLKLISMDNSDF